MASEAMKTNEDKDSPSSIQAHLESFVEVVIMAYQSLHGVTIQHHELENRSMVESGCNIASSVLRMRLTFEKNEEICQSSVVIKVPHLSPSYTFLKELRLYEREVYMYETVLPRMYHFLPHKIMSPTYYGASSVQILALENLEESGFHIPHQNNSLLDFTECKVVLETMGKFHALSLKYMQIHGTKEFDTTMNFSFGSAGSSGDFLPCVFGSIGKCVVPFLPEDHQNAWSEFLKNPMAALAIAYNSHSIGGIQVVLHGDLHSGNILWKNDECKLIDFQFSHRGPLALDLIYFLLTSVKSDVFRQHREDLFQYYLGALNGVLQELDCVERYTLVELNDDFGKYRLYSIFVLSLIVPMLWSGVGNFAFGCPAEGGLDKFNDVIQSEKYISSFKNWMDLI